MSRVFLGFPGRGAWGSGVVVACISAAKRHQFATKICQTGDINVCFNELFKEAYNDRKIQAYDRFCLHHDDIFATIGFLDVMCDEMDRVNADVLSVVAPVKDDRGLTSTAVCIPNTLNVRRLTLAETYQLPETFSIADTPWPDRWLLVNTGLMLWRFDAPWVDEFTGFQTRTWVNIVDGLAYPGVWPEDFGFSSWANHKGLRVFATRAVQVKHRGSKDYDSCSPWGDWKADRECQEFREGVINADDNLASTGNGGGDRRNGNGNVYVDKQREVDHERGGRLSSASGYYGVGVHGEDLPGHDS